jgi:hypothetical protein
MPPQTRADTWDSRERRPLSRETRAAGRRTLARRPAPQPPVPVDGISEEIRKGQKALELLLRKAKSTLQALNIELYDERSEMASPIELPSGSFESARLALPRGEEAACEMGCCRRMQRMKGG